MGMVTLSDTTQKLQALLGGAVSANECPITVSYRDVRKDALAGGNEASPVIQSDDTITSGASAVDVVDPAPAGIRRTVTDFSLHNADSASVTVTVRKYVNASTTRIIYKSTLATTETLHFSESRGWYVIAADGAQRTSAGTDASNALSAVTSAGLADSISRSSATSGGLADSVSRSSAVSAGLADSVTRSAATSNGLVNSQQTSSITSGNI